jgi:hypothetical protein
MGTGDDMGVKIHSRLVAANKCYFGLLKHEVIADIKEDKGHIIYNTDHISTTTCFTYLVFKKNRRTNIKYL